MNSTEIIYTNKSFFDLLLKRLSKEKRIDQKICLGEIAARFATFNHCGIFVSYTLEKELISVANQIKISLSPGFQKNSFLHIMTTCYTAGGHTAVVENWIKFAPKDQKHSLVLIDQGNTPVRETLFDAVKSQNGEIIQLKNLTPLEKAIRLRELASSYEFVILHVHMFDLIPVLAFGTEDFERPVLVYNHAGHMFWVGATICDLLLNLSLSEQYFSIAQRKITKNAILPIPLSPPNLSTLSTPPNILKNKLKIPSNSRVILTVGSSVKLKPLNNLNFVSVALDLLKINNNLFFLIIGPNKDEKIWVEASERGDGRIKVLNVVPRSELDNYIGLADLYIDSFPMNGGTIALEVALSGVPIISVKTGFCQFDSILDHTITFDKLEIEVIKRLNPQSENLEDLKAKITELHCKDGWLKKYKFIFEEAPKKHALYINFDDPQSMGDFNYLILHFCNSHTELFEEYSLYSTLNPPNLIYFFTIYLKSYKFEGLPRLLKFTASLYKQKIIRFLKDIGSFCHTK
jgi:glycosyltransferase involved in cell wall biosynthesis